MQFYNDLDYSIKPRYHEKDFLHNVGCYVRNGAFFTGKEGEYV